MKNSLYGTINLNISLRLSVKIVKRSEILCGFNFKGCVNIYQDIPKIYESSVVAHARIFLTYSAISAF